MSNTSVRITRVVSTSPTSSASKTSEISKTGNTSKASSTSTTTTTKHRSVSRPSANLGRRMPTTTTESVIETGFTRGLWSQILPGFFQGGTGDDDTVADARNPRAKAEITPEHFDLVVTAYAWARPVDWHVTELRVGFYDAGIENIEMDQLKLAVVTAHDAWKSGKRVLSRCQA
ncbi:MAG: hypothetical protein KGP01_05480, partial [Actinomycetales bacterium]|nr:hypothetical protein [Actinomycetales bacterium]